MIKKVIDNRDPYKQGRILVEGISYWIPGVCYITNELEFPSIGDEVNVTNYDQHQYYFQKILS